MTHASKVLKALLGEAYSAPIPAPVGTQGGNNAQLVPDPNDAKNYSSQTNKLDIQNQQPLAAKIGNIIDSLDDDDITDELADIVERYLEEVDQTGDMNVEDAAMLLPIDQCQQLYDELTGYLKDNDIGYSETDTDDMGLPTSIPADLYPSSSGMILGGPGIAPSHINVGS